jgi:hypothetical protein
MKSSRTSNVKLYHELHAGDAEYGRSSIKLQRLITTVVRESLRDGSFHKIETICDFGCGKSILIDRVASDLNCIGYRYDPAIPDYSTPPAVSIDLVLNTDVLEHIHESDLSLIFSDIFSLSDYVFFNISTRPAVAILSNGENAHVTIKPGGWWLEKIREYASDSAIIFENEEEVSIITWTPSASLCAKVSRLKSKRLIDKLRCLFD